MHSRAAQATTAGKSRTSCVGVGGRSVTGHQLVRDAAGQEPAHRAEFGRDVPVRLVVDEVPVDLRLGPLVYPSRGIDIMRTIFRMRDHVTYWPV